MPELRERCGSVWSIVPAGGDGMRLRRLVRRIHGDERPKQFATIASRQSLLRETLQRAALLSPCHRTVIVAKADHARHLLKEREAGRMPSVLAQPADRGTAAGVLLPVRYVHAHDPEAVVAVLPSDHFIAENADFVAHVAEVTRIIRTNPDRVVVLGARPDGPETEYGWIEPGRTLGRTSAGPISAVSRVLEPGHRELLVSHLRALTWCDLGTPQRVFQAVRQLDLRPPWLGAGGRVDGQRVSA